jgi:hypothetical protein
MKTYIYTLSTPDTKEIRYIGKTTNLNRRKHQHFSKKSALSIRNRKLGNWLLKYLNANVKPIISVIEEVEENWKEREMYWIAYYKDKGCNLCNLTKGGEGVIGFKMRPESIEKMRRSLTGRKLSIEHINKIKNNWLGRKHSEKSKILMSKPIKCIEDNKIFSSTTEAAKYYKVLKTTITNILNGRSKKTRTGKSFCRV